MNLVVPDTLGFAIGGLYSRAGDVHARFGGQRQGGISTPKDHPYVFAFTGEVGRDHGYHDFWDTHGRFHYFGEGQTGDMKFTGGNRAILEHQKLGKRLFVFQMLGHGKPYRFLGEFQLESTYQQTGALTRAGLPRTAIVFVLRPMLGPLDSEAVEPQALADGAAMPASKEAVVQVRARQWLFRRRVADMEKGCRLTGISDLRFLRASHIKPWAACHHDSEKLDGNNGLLLCPQGDLLFDRGWISFEDTGRLIVASHLPADVRSRIGVRLTPGRKCGEFRDGQRDYLEFHRKVVFERRFSEIADPLAGLTSDGATSG